MGVEQLFSAPIYGARRHQYLVFSATQRAAIDPLASQEFFELALDWYGIKKFESWADRAPEKVGEIFLYDWAGRWDFFAQKAAYLSYFPTDQRSDSGWDYIGSAALRDRPNPSTALASRIPISWKNRCLPSLFCH